MEYLRAERTGNVENWDRLKLKHIHEVLNLLQSISHNDVFSKMEDFIEQTQSQTGGIQMSEFVQNWINKGRSEGINSMTSLMSRLYAEGRDSDVKRAMTDSAYLAESGL